MLRERPAGCPALPISWKVAAARRIGGVVNSANIQEQAECTCTLLFDHTFDER